jgi:hypothetical protein
MNGRFTRSFLILVDRERAVVSVAPWLERDADLVESAAGVDLEKLSPRGYLTPLEII